jgi:hypothetical protein
VLSETGGNKRGTGQQLYFLAHLANGIVEGLQFGPLGSAGGLLGFALLPCYCVQLRSQMGYFSHADILAYNPAIDFS